MPFDIAALRKRGVDLKVDVFGDTMSVTYNPLVIGQPNFREKYMKSRGKLFDGNRKRMEKEDAGVDDLASTLRHTWQFWAETVCEMITDWDVEIDGQPVAIEPVTFLGSAKKDAIVPPEVANKIAEAVWNDYGLLGNPPSSNGTKPG